MIAAFKSELRKLFTVRSTYIITLIACVAVVLFAGYIFGYKLKGPELLNGNQLGDSIRSAIAAVAIFGGIVSTLLMAHEYRYNTILYSLTSNRSRSVFLLAKIAAATLFAVLFTVLICVISPLLTLAGVHLAGHSLAAQSIPYSDIVWRSLFYGWGYSMIALLIAALVRNQIGAIVSLFIIPSTVETLLGLLMKDNVVYLPFSALGAVIHHDKVLSYGHAALVFGAYLVVGWLVAWILFLRRDAN